VELAQIVVALVRDGHPALVRVDGAEGEILRRRLALGQHVEEGGLPAVGRNTQKARNCQTPSAGKSPPSGPQTQRAPEIAYLLHIYIPCAFFVCQIFRLRQNVCD